MTNVLVYLEKFGFYALAGGILYAIGVLTLNPNELRIHFVTLFVILFLGEVALLFHRYLKQKFMSDRMKNIVQSMKVE